MSPTFAIVGTGRQGIASAFDLANHHAVERLVLADISIEKAEEAAARIDRLVGRAVSHPTRVNASDPAGVAEVLDGIDVAVCAAPFPLIPACTEAAIRAGSSMVDLGGHTPTVLGQLERDEEARIASVTIVPDCGMGPGMNNTLGLYAFERLEQAGSVPFEIRLYDGGLPREPRRPWGYRLLFHINGLTNEYDGHAQFLRDGTVTDVPAMSELEEVTFDDVGTLEAFVTSGGTSTVPYTMEGKLDVYENKTLRYPGHFAAFRAFKDLGLFDETPMHTPRGEAFVPRDVYHTLLEPLLVQGPPEDICVMRAVGRGRRDGEVIAFTVDLIDRFDPVTGFTAMERLTGFHAAIMAGLIARGEVRPGVVKLEEAVPATMFVEEVRRRGFALTERWT